MPISNTHTHALHAHIHDRTSSKDDHQRWESLPRSKLRAGAGGGQNFGTLKMHEKATKNDVVVQDRESNK
jgi:hypothetical protein